MSPKELSKIRINFNLLGKKKKTKQQNLNDAENYEKGCCFKNICNIKQKEQEALF